MRRLASVALVCLIALAGCRAPSPQPEPPTPEAVRVTLLHVNDSHGRTEPHLWFGRSVGGYARLATRVDEIRREGTAERVLLLHAGDLLSRGDELTRRTRGRVNVALMNHVGFDLWTPGNGEFYDGVPNLKRLLAAFDGTALAANVYGKDTGDRLAPPAAILDAGPVRVGVVGLCLVRTRHPSARGLRVTDPIDEAARHVAALRERVDLVVALTHLGVDTDMRLARQVPGVDLIVGGHSHTELPRGRRVEGPRGREVLIVQAGEHLRNLGRVDVDLVPNGDGWRIGTTRARLLPIDADTPLDPSVTALIATHADEVSRTPAGAGGKADP